MKIVEPQDALLEDRFGEFAAVEAVAVHHRFDEGLDVLAGHVEALGGYGSRKAKQQERRGVRQDAVLERTPQRIGLFQARANVRASG
ncbi:MAG: hypothetical protein HC794_02620 [Nitrospiraceae bacterium]|nr:hypothetical protein [Nitrospiraceae bacterium]